MKLLNKYYQTQDRPSAESYLVHPFLTSCFDSYTLIGLNMVFKTVLPILKWVHLDLLMKMSCETTENPAKVNVRHLLTFPFTQGFLCCHGENQLDSAVCSLKIHVDNTYVICPVFSVLFICSSVFLGFYFKLSSPHFPNFSIHSHSGDRYFGLLF